MYDVEIYNLWLTDGSYIAGYDALAPIGDPPFLLRGEVNDGEIITGTFYVIVPDGVQIQAIRLLLIGIEEIAILIEEY